MLHPYTTIYNLVDNLTTQRGGSVVINLFTQHTHTHTHTHTHKLPILRQTTKDLPT